MISLHISELMVDVLQKFLVERVITLQRNLCRLKNFLPLVHMLVRSPYLKFRKF